MKTAFGLLILIALGSGGYFAWTKWQSQESSSAHQRVLATAEVERRNINFAVNAAGEIGPAEQVSVRPEITGKISVLAVDIGDYVRKDDLLFALDDEVYINERDSSRTEVERAHLQLDQAQRTFERGQRLFQQNLISVEEMDNFKTQYDLAKNSLERAQKDLAVVEDRLTKTKILAPFDCTVLARPVSIGQAVSGSGGVGGGTEVLAIADLRSMIIQAHVNQADVTRLKVGHEVEIQVEAVPGLTVQGKVERIAPQATVKSNIKGFLTRILLENVDPRIRPGMTANIKIPVATVADVLAVPLSAVFTEFNQETSRSERFVYVRKQDKYERRPVQVGLSDFFHAEIQTGVEVGDKVCLEQPPQDQVIVVEQTVQGGPGVSTQHVPSASAPGRTGGNS